jgi:flagellar protein FlgJ
MDFNTIGTQFFNQARNPFTPAPAPSISGQNPGTGFDELLRMAQNARSTSENGTPVSRNAPIDRSSKLFELCLELETFLIKNLISGMRSTIQKSNLIDTGFAGEVYEDMLYDEYAKVFARNANLGFAEMAYRELTGSR